MYLLKYYMSLKGNDKIYNKIYSIHLKFHQYFIKQINELTV